MFSNVAWPRGIRLFAALASLAGIAGAAENDLAGLTPAQFGAVADGVTLDTAAFQRAIDEAHAKGGGVVRVPAGEYVIGTIELRSGVTLDLAEGALVKGSPRIADYRRGHWPALIKARDQRGIAITGRGTIDGQGTLVAQDTVRIFESGRLLEFFPGLAPGEKVFTGTGNGSPVFIEPHALAAVGKLQERVAPRSRADLATWRVDELVRPQIIEFWNCRDVRVSGVTLRNAANWVQTYRECEDVVIEHLRVDSVTYWNNDGLDLVNSRRVRIEHCDINAADDGICLKSEPSPDNRGCEDITIAHCRIRSSASALKFGTASHVAFRRIQAHDLEVYDTYRSAVALESVDGAVLEDVTVSRVNARRTGNAIFIKLGQRNPARPPGILRNIALSDFVVEVPAGRPDEGYAHAGPAPKVLTNLLPASISGLPDRPVENVTLRNISIVYGGGGRRDRAEIPLTALELVPEQRGAYPEFTMFGELPAWGFYLRHVRGLVLENVSLKLAAPDFRAAMVADDVHGLTLQQVEFASAGEEPILVLAGVSDEKLADITWPDHPEPIRRLPAP